MSLQMALHYHLSELYFPSSLNKNESSNEDEDEEPKKKSRLIGYKKRKTINTSSSEKVAIVLGVFFIAAVTCYAFYLGYENDLVPESSQITFSELLFDNPETNKLYNEPRLPKDFIPLHYTLYVYPELETMNYTGLVKIRVQCTVNTTQLVFHSTQHKISKIALKTINVTDIEDILVSKSSVNVRRETIVLALNQVLVAGYQYDMYIGFVGNLTSSYTKGIYVTEQRNTKEKIISTLFHPTFARKAFPCFDEPQFKTPFQLILQHDNTLKAISNMDTNKTVSLGINKNVEAHFETTPPISTHQLSFVISNLKNKEITSINGVKIRVFAQSSDVEYTMFVLDVAPKIIDYYSNLIKFNYTNKKLDLVVVPSLPLPKLSSYGIIQMHEPSILYDEKVGTLFEQEHILVELAESIAFQWFGNIVSLRWWNEGYLYGGFSKYFSQLLLEGLYPDWDFMKIFLNRWIQMGLREDSSVHSNPLATETPGIVSGFLSKKEIETGKAGSVIAMMAEKIGKTNFLKTVKGVLKQRKFTATTLKELGDIFVTYVPDVDVVDYMHYWTTQRGFPLVTTKISETNTQLLVVQNRFSYVKEPGWTLWSFQLPTKFSCSPTDKIFSTESHNDFFGLPGGCLNSTVKFGVKDWYKSNVGGGRFYRVDYDKSDWKSLLNVLNTKHQVLAPLDRANLLSDIFELAKFNYRSIGDAMAFTVYLGNETSFAPIQAVLSQLNSVASLVEDVKLKKCMKQYTNEKVTQIFKIISQRKVTTNEEKHLFELLVDIVTNEQNPLSESYIRDYDIQFLKWVISGERNLLSTYLRDVIFKVGLKYGDSYELNDIKDYYIKSKSSVEKDLILKTLGSIGQYEVLIPKRESNIAVLTVAEKLRLLTYSCQQEGARAIALSLIGNQWADTYALVYTDPELVKGFMWKCFKPYKTTFELQKFQSAFKGISLGPLTDVYQRVTEQIQHNIDFIRLQSGELSNFFNKFYPSCL